MNAFEKIWTEKDESEAGEKHVPIIEVEENEETEIYIKVGSILHPSEAEHFIEWIELYDGEIPLQRVYLSHFSIPIAIFYTAKRPRELKVKVFCNMHGVWESKYK